MFARKVRCPHIVDSDDEDSEGEGKRHQVSDQDGRHRVARTVIEVRGWVGKLELTSPSAHSPVICSPEPMMNTIVAKRQNY